MLEEKKIIIMNFFGHELDLNPDQIKPGLDIWRLSTVKKKNKHRQSRRMLTVTRFRRGYNSSISEMGKRQFQVFHHSHILFLPQCK
ncbi:hypothetical protein Zm00014a_024432 [Zea mays]|uniref:Uncharacterized protein n=1 Tax=Zea mays TaxID=4577 RepID=A0A3L6EE91_MAIZE|nr:hypothetical protein Zm00014a_024432 [Zea mays]